MLKAVKYLCVAGALTLGAFGATSNASATTVFEGSSHSQFVNGGLLYGQEWDIALSGKFYLQDPADFSVESDQPFHLVTLGYWNVLGLGDATANINTQLTLSSPAGMEPNPLVLNFGADADDGGGILIFVGNDWITLAGTLIYTFEINGVEGELEILGFKKGDEFVDSIKVKSNDLVCKDIYAVFRFNDETGTGNPDTPVVPLPAAAWGGMTLLGGIGAARLRRRKA